jgi:hypothetical protein
MTDPSGFSIALGAKPALAIVAMPIANAAPKIGDRIIVFSSLLFSRPLPQCKRVAMNSR